jgi:uncharacterized membrane protein
MKLSLFVLLLILLSFSALSETLVLDLYSLSNIPIEGRLVEFKINNNSTLTYSETNSYILELTQGNYFIEIFVKNENSANEFYNSIEYVLSEDSSLNVNLFQVGTITGFVFDNKEQPIPESTVYVDCVNTYYEPGESLTNNIGFFTIDNAPVGSCIVYAIHDETLGYAEVSLSAGETTSTNIYLNKELSKPELATVLITIVILISIIVFGIKKYLKKDKSIPVLKTLRGNEKKIFEYLKEKGEVWQSEIMKELNIPKTSTYRALNNLKDKNIVHVKTHGNNKQVQIQDWLHR